MWAAKDKDGEIGLYATKPHKNEICGEWMDDIGCLGINDDDYISDNSIEWDDNKPVECVVVPLSEYKRDMHELLEYKTSALTKMELHKVIRHKGHCDKCDTDFTYSPTEIITFSYSPQPSSDYEEEMSYVICPHCGNKIWI